MSNPRPLSREGAVRPDAFGIEHKGAWFQSICDVNDFTVSDDQRDLLEEYVELLLDWNKKLNLISRQDEPNIWERHILHSASILFHLSLLSDGRVLDLGTGGGLPGIPLKILSPALSLNLIDSVRKKAVAVADMVEQLSLTDTRIDCGRAEELGTRKEFMGKFDYVITRGVANLKQLAEWSFPFLRLRRPAARVSSQDQRKTFINSPALIAMKGGDLEKEIAFARRSSNVRDITITDLTVQGFQATPNPDRKAVIVYFN